MFFLFPPPSRAFFLLLLSTHKMDKALKVIDVPQAKSIWDPSLELLCQQHGIQLSDEQNFSSLTGHLVRYVLPFLSNEKFEQVMTDFGALHWKESDDTVLTQDESKLLLIQVVQRTNLEPLLLVYMSLWERDNKKFPEHIYTLGLGHHLRLFLHEHSSKNLYYRSMSHSEIILMNPVMPDLSHENNYTFSASDFCEMTYTGTKRRLYDTTRQTNEALIYIKMLLATSAAGFERWNECWAHALSALDHVTILTPCFHDLMCILAKSSGMSSLNKAIPIRLLKFARLQGDFAVDHIFHRLLVFHSLIIHWGYFQLEEELFQLCQQIFPKNTELYHNLLHQHLKSLLNQIENIILFQYVRQQYHSNCNNGNLDTACNKLPLIEVSFCAVEKLLRQMEKWITEIPWNGEKEYYTALMYYYSTFNTPNGNACKRAVAQRLLIFAQKHLKVTDYRFVDAKIINELESNMANLESFVTDTFAPRTYSKYSPEAAETFIRSMIFVIMTQTPPKTRVSTISTDVCNYYSSATHKRGYRANLLKCIPKIFAPAKRHNPLNHPDLDYPSVDVCLNRPDIEYEAVYSAFKNEKNFYLQRVQCDIKELLPKRGAIKRRKLADIPVEDPYEDTDALSSLLLLGMDYMGEQVYAFGYYLTHQLTA